MPGGHSVPGGTLDITELILDDHREQRRLFAILEQIDRSDTGVLSAIWDRLASFLELHAAAEEAIFYPVLLQVGVAAHRAAGVEGETLDAIHDHNEIRDAVTEVGRHQVGTDEWFGAVAAANLANSDHMAEEEREGLTDFRRLAGLQRRHQLAVAFVAYEARNFAGVPAVDKDPATYVREAEEEGHEPGRGFLSTGSLKRGEPARGRYPGLTGGPWPCSFLVLSLFQAVVVLLGFRRVPWISKPGRGARLGRERLLRQPRRCHIDAVRTATMSHRCGCICRTGRQGRG